MGKLLMRNACEKRGTRLLSPAADFTTTTPSSTYLHYIRLYLFTYHDEYERPTWEERTASGPSQVRIYHYGHTVIGFVNQWPPFTALVRFLADFSKALSNEVRLLLQEVGQLRDERRQLQ